MNIRHKDTTITLLTIALVILLILSLRETSNSSNTHTQERLDQLTTSIASLEQQMLQTQQQITQYALEANKIRTSSTSKSDLMIASQTPHRKPTATTKAQEIHRQDTQSKVIADEQYYIDTRNSLLQKARSGSNTIHHIFSSDEVQALPDAQRTELLRQITELINNGEVDPEHFLKGD